MGCSQQNSAQAKIDEYSKKKGIPIQIKNFVEQNMDTMKAHYKAGNKIGEGKFGKVFTVTHLSTNTQRVMKIININKITKVIEENPNEPHDTEIDILCNLDHPNIQKVYEYFTDGTFYYLILEYVKGKNISEFIFEKGVIDEKTIAFLFKQIISVIAYLHQRNIIYCNINPSNITVINKNLDIKITGFSLSKELNPKYFLTLYSNENIQFLAPEVFNGSYSFPSDIYSCGVLLYNLFTGEFPLSQKPIEKTEQWKNMSNELQDLLVKMLNKDPYKRIKADDVLKHPWLKLSNATVRRESMIKMNFSSLSQEKLKQATQAYIVHQMDNNILIDKLRKNFRFYDKSGEGLISREELKLMVNKISDQNISEIEINDLMDKIDQDNSGSISFEEFLRVMIDYNTLLTKDNLQNAFKFFDKDKSGLLSVKEMKEIFSRNDLVFNSNEKEIDNYIQNVLAKYDKDNDGSLNFEEFVQLISSS